MITPISGGISSSDSTLRSLRRSDGLAILRLMPPPRAGFDRLAPADGAFYVYADVSHLTDDSRLLCRRWLEEIGVTTGPGIDFDLARGHQYVRFSYSGHADDIAEGCRRLAAWVGSGR